MAELLTAANVLTALVDIASRVQTAGENYYKARAEWNAFVDKVSRFRSYHEEWLDTFTKYGMSDKGLIRALEEANLLLEVEEKKLSDRRNLERTTRGRLKGFFAKAHVLVFPSEINSRIQRVEDAFAEIRNLQKVKEDARAAAEWELLNRSPSLKFKKDERYVPLEETELHIYSAVEKFMVVLLYGGPGKGKSSLARNVALHYKNATKKAPKKATREAPQITNCTLFEQVVFLECGPQADTLAQQQLLFQQLGLSRVSLVEGQQSAPDISQLLIGALKFQNVLIILDDVWDHKFLQDMIGICGDNVKCLVTAQRGDLCSHLSWPSTHNIHKIQIQEISQEIGRKILASHVGFPDRCIANKQIMDIADQMIKDTTGNPLALASVVSAIEDTKRDSEEIWEVAYGELMELLKAKDTRPLFQQEYPRSFWAATKLSIQSLQKEAQSLLILMHLCKGPSVPEEVIRFLVGRIDLLGEGVTFQKLVNQLEGRELVKINDTLTFNSHQSEKSWSTHSLQKLVIDEDEELREQKRGIFESLLGFPNTMHTEPSVKIEISTCPSQVGDVVVTKVLSALYFEQEFAENAASLLGIEVARLNVQQRQAFEPITRLLGKPLIRGWTPAAQTAAKQVFVRYFCKCEFDDENISLLLKMIAYPSAQFAILAAIANIYFIEDAPLLNKDSKVPAGLVSCLRRNDAPILQEKAASALLALSYGGGISTSLQILNEEGALEELVRCLSYHANPILQECATKVLFNLTIKGGEAAKLQIVSQEGALTRLAGFLAEHDNPGLQKQAARVLMNLSFESESRKNRILKEDGVLEELVHCLSCHANPILQECAASVLVNLADGGEAAQLQIMNQEGALAGLAGSLAKDDNPGLQKQALWALTNLAAGSESRKDKILNLDGAFQGLVHCLSCHADPGLQEDAAKVLANLAAGGEAAKFQILNQEGALVGLVRCLSKDDNLVLQQYSAEALSSLASGPQSSKLKILKEEGALEGLVKSVSKHKNPALQKSAREALENLAAGAEELRLQLVDENPELAGLVNSVLQKYNKS